MRFENPWFLLLLLLIPILHKLIWRRQQPPRVTFPIAIAPAVARSNPIRILLILRYVSLVFFIVSLARPQSSYKQTERKVSGIDIMVLMDVSHSMNIEDLSDRSRFEIARETIRNFIQGRQNDRIGFAVFSGEPLTLAPPTLDYGLVLKQLGDARTGVLKDGTGIGDGLALAVGRLRNSDAKSRVIILLTDGDNNIGQVDPETAGELAAGYGIKVYTIAVGREGRVKIPIKHETPFGRSFTTYQFFDNALNPELLQSIAKLTSGKFYRVTEEKTLGDVFQDIDRLERTEIKTREHVRYDEIFGRPLKAGILALLVERVLALGLWRFVL